MDILMMLAQLCVVWLAMFGLFCLILVIANIIDIKD